MYKVTIKLIQNKNTINFQSKTFSNIYKIIETIKNGIYSKWKMAG